MILLVKCLLIFITTIINNLKNLDKIYSNEEMIEKVLRSLPKHWQPNVMAVREVKELSKIFLEQLMGSLITHEMKLAFFFRMKTKGKA